MLGIILGLYFRKHPGMARAQVTLHGAAEKWDTWLLAISQRQHHLGHFTQLHGGRANLHARARGKPAVLSSTVCGFVLVLAGKESNYICNLLISGF